MKLRDLMFVLPNLFTVSSIFCGFYAMTLCAGDASPTQLYQAALAIFFGIFFDGFDGRNRQPVGRVGEEAPTRRP